MNRFSFTTVCACCALFSSPVLACPSSAAQDAGGHDQAASTGPVNAMCPIGMEPVEADGGRTVYKDKTIGFCCPGCISRFEAWDESKKDEFVSMSMMNPKAGMKGKHKQMAGHAEGVKDNTQTPYTLNTCPISGQKLGSMGDPVVKNYDGRQVKFCCKMCVPKFEKDLEASFAKLDQKIMESQMPFYPTSDCIVSDEPLTGADGMDEPVDIVYNGRLVRLCCKMCKGDFKDDPQTFMKKLDAAVIAEQGAEYPLENCPISGGKLGSMGKPAEIVFAGRLVKFCCKMCIPKFEANPMPTIEKIDAAWKAKHDG